MFRASLRWRCKPHQAVQLSAQPLKFWSFPRFCAANPSLKFIGTGSKIQRLPAFVASLDHNMGTSMDDDYNPYRSKASSLAYGLLYKQEKFCARCRSVDWHDCMQQLQTQFRSSEAVPLYKRHVKLRDQGKSCDLCSNIYYALMSHPELKRYDDHLRKCEKKQSCGSLYHILGDEDVLVGLCDLDGDYNVEVKVSSTKYGAATAGQRRKPHALKQANVEPKRNPDNLMIAKHWFQECTQDHKACSLTSEIPILPTRVIDVQSSSLSGNPQPRLVLTNGKCDRYATLSYVWGNGPRFTASTKELYHLCHSIELSSLPRLFQDAILTTRQLGIPYLWIDAVCILQDAPDDVQRELSGMSDIYYNSTLTLAAVGQRSVHSSLMRQQTPGYGEIFGTPLVRDESPSFFISMLPFGHPATLTYPLHTRAWCLQEGLLSHRVLVLGLREMFWFCRSYQRRAAEWQSGKRRLATDYEAELFGPLTEKWILHSDLPKRPYNFWYHTIAKYSNRQRSVPEDKLPALSAFANKMSQLYLPSITAAGVPNTYLAGLWRDDLYHGLLWRGHAKSYRSSHTRVQGIPTWTWAAWDIEISAWRRHVPPIPKDEDAFVPLATILHCATELASAGVPLGHVVSGTLTLRGDVAVLPFDVSLQNYDSWLLGNARYISKYCECPKPGTQYQVRSCGWCYRGIWVNAPDQIGENCVIIRMTKREALILAPKQDPGPPIFERVGLLVAHSNLREDLGWEKGREVTIL